MTITYILGRKLYLNITNACPCACVFCIRNYSDSVGDAESLWLEREPTLDEIKAAFESRSDLNQVDEIVFCGYGEPFERADDVIQIAEFIKARYYYTPLRINTNGLVRLINPTFDISRLAIANSVSVSLNADDAEEYMRMTNPRFGIVAYSEMLEFVKIARNFTNVTLTVVDTLSPERLENCYRLADSLKLPLIVRSII